MSLQDLTLPDPDLFLFTMCGLETGGHLLASLNKPWNQQAQPSHAAASPALSPVSPKEPTICLSQSSQDTSTYPVYTG